MRDFFLSQSQKKAAHKQAFIVVWLTCILKLIGLIEIIEYRPWSDCFNIWVFVRGSFERNK